MARITAIVSGGQSGVDRAALDVAIARGLPYRGFAPKGGWAEDFPELPGLLVRYPGLVETESRDPAERTEKNVLAADVTLAILPGKGKAQSPGTDRTLAMAARHKRPCLIIDASDPGSVTAAAAALREMEEDISLNIAGPRESEAPGIYLTTRRVIDALLTALES